VAALAATASPAAPAASTPRCATSGLLIWFSPQLGSGYAGGYYYNLNFTNLSGYACTLQGYPGVSAVNLSGQQLGSPAGWGDAKLRTVRLANGATATAQLQVADAANCGCTVTAAGLRVYPPEGLSTTCLLAHGLPRLPRRPGSPLLSRSITGISQLSGRTLNMHERSPGPPNGRADVSAGIEAQLAAAKAPFMADSPSTWLANRRNRVRDLEHSRRLARGDVERPVLCVRHGLPIDCLNRPLDDMHRQVGWWLMRDCCLRGRTSPAQSRDD
jgi:uncharacterized protein DUF4232